MSDTSTSTSSQEIVLNKNIVAPMSTFQEEILNSDADILITGGGVGASKSYIGLMRHLRWTDLKGYVGYCIRRNSTMLTMKGGLWSEAISMYSKVYPDIKINKTEKVITFPSGASVSFSHYEDDNAGRKYHGSQICGCFYDEATQAEEDHILWLWTRCRTASVSMKPNMWLTCNPDPDSWMRVWVDWWLYPEGHPLAGLPDPERNGKIRYLRVVGDTKYWANTREELLEKFGYEEIEDIISNKIVKVDPSISVRVLLGTIKDNPVLLRKDPTYPSRIRARGETETRRLLLGDWNARQTTSSYFSREWMIEKDVEPPKSEIIKTVRAYDLASTLVSDMNKNPDYTSSIKFSKLKNGEYFIHDVRRIRIRAGDWVRHIVENSKYDGAGVEVILPQDPNAAAKFATQQLIKELVGHGIFVRVFKTNKSKLDRFRPVSSAAQNGLISILKNCGYDFENGVDADLNFFYKELEAFTGVRKNRKDGHDDLVDSLSDAFASVADTINLSGILGGLKSIDMSVPRTFYN